LKRTLLVNFPSVAYVVQIEASQALIEFVEKTVVADTKLALISTGQAFIRKVSKPSAQVI